MEDILDDSINNDNDNEPILKQRHGCVTAYLVFMIIVNAATAFSYFFANQLILDTVPGASSSLLYALGLIGMANVIFAIMLWQWKKIGFYGFIGSSIAAFALNIMMGLEVQQTLLGLIGIAIVYAILQIKQDGRSAWENME